MPAENENIRMYPGKIITQACQQDVFVFECNILIRYVELSEFDIPLSRNY